MQKNNIEDLKTADNLTKEESFGGFQYKRNYDEYKKELTDEELSQDNIMRTIAGGKAQNVQ